MGPVATNGTMQSEDMWVNHSVGGSKLTKAKLTEAKLTEKRKAQHFTSLSTKSFSMSLMGALFAFFAMALYSPAHAQHKAMKNTPMQVNINHKAMKNTSMQVNINLASAKEIAKALSGIGIKTAEKIVIYRDKNGAFKKKEDLMKVRGIGKKLLARNKTRILIKKK